MNCFYHNITLANTRCHVCARPLCPACDHRVKGFTYCQDCIVSGVENLHRNAPIIATQNQHKVPAAAAFLGLVPGLGAVYNGTIIRALVHFTVTVGLWQLDDIFDSSLFMWSGIAFYVYSIYDAFQNAKRLNAGVNLSHEEAALKQQLQDKTKIWGSALIGLGVLTILNWVMPPEFMNGFWPLLFIGFGIYLVAFFQKKSSSTITKKFTNEIPPQIPSAVSFDPIAHDYSQAETRRFDVR